MAKKSILSNEELIISAKKYADVKQIRTDNILLYNTIIRRKISKIAFSHMPTRSSWDPEIDGGWTIEALKKEIGTYEFLCDLRNKSPNAYAAIIRRKLKYLISHLKKGQHIRTDDELRKDALLCESKKEFKTKFHNSYTVAIRRPKIFFEDICSHMKRPKVSPPEREILTKSLEYFPSAKKKLFTKIEILDKPFIKALEIDIFIPELNKGIEYDGEWYHSSEGLIRSHPTWPKIDAISYHEIKDSYFLSQGIQILHIKEQDWIKDKQICINRCLDFLGVSNEL